MRVLTFSRTFPAYHPRAGQPTFFVEKIWAGLADSTDLVMGNVDMDFHEYYNGVPKWHTIRAGNRWKAGDWFSPRIWGNDINPKSGKSGPYQSKQITLAPDVEVKKVWPVEIDECGVMSVNGFYLLEDGEEETLAKNDGLSYQDFTDWLIMPVFRAKRAWHGQIICWSDTVEYSPAKP